MIAGLDPKKNFFLDFVCKIPFKMPDAKKYKAKMQYVYDSYENNKLSLKLPVLLNESLWDRSDADFRYALNAFNLFSQPKLYKSYIKDVSRVNINEFMNADTVKPSGQDGKEGVDSIYNVIEKWAKDNEYSPEEIAERKKKAAEEEENTKSGKGVNSSTVTVNVNGGNGSNNLEWTYEFFKDSLEKVFANKGKFETKLPNKNDYLERAFVTFTLPELTPQETSNKIYKKSTTDIEDKDVEKFGNTRNVDEPIYVSVRDQTTLRNGVYVFHKFVPLDGSSLNYYKQLAKKNLGNLERHLNKVNPNNDADIDTHLQSVVTALEGLSGITQK